MTRGFTLVSLMLAALSACSAVTPGSRVTRRDSAGVSITESASPRWGETAGWRVSPDPVLDLGTSGEGEAHEFFGVRDAVTLRDGSIAVALGRAGEIRFYSSTGEFLKTVGRRGEGPGEFQALSGLERFAGDSILAYDRRARRITVLSPEWEVVRIISLEPALASVVRPIGDSSFLALVSSLGAEGVVNDGHTRRPSAVIRYSRTGLVIDTVTTTLGPESVILDGGAVDARPLFGKDSYLATLNGRIYLGAAEAMEFAIFASDGVVERIVRVPDYDLRLSEEAVEAEKSTQMELVPTAARREYLSSLPIPEFRPAYADLRVDPDGFVWVAEHNGYFMNLLGSEPQDWEIFDPTGEWLGSVRLPARFTVFDIGLDYVLGVARDGMDVEQVRVLRLVR